MRRFRLHGGPADGMFVDVQENEKCKFPKSVVVNLQSKDSGLPIYVLDQLTEEDFYVYSNQTPIVLPEPENTTNLPDHINIPSKYWPAGVSSQGFSPGLLRMNAEIRNRHQFNNQMEIYSSILLFLLDNVDWKKFKDNEETQTIWPLRASR